MKDKDLINLIKEDPDRGITIAVDLYGGIIKAICNNILRGYNQSDIEEAWSDTFVKLWKNADRFDSKRNSSLKTYIGTIARSVALDTRRRCNRTTPVADGEMEDSIVDISIDIEDDYSKKENDKILHETVAEMDEPDRSIFIMRFFYFTPVKKIAENLSISPKQVENVLFRRKAKLKDMLLERGVVND